MAAGRPPRKRIGVAHPEGAAWPAKLLPLLVLFAVASPARADVAAAAGYSKQSGETALLIWDSGRIVFERQANGGRDAPIFSVTKSLAALGVLQAVGRGRLRLDDRVAETLTEWRSDPLKSRITVRDLLHQTSGLSPGYKELYRPVLPDITAVVTRLPVLRPPGGAFAYGPSHYEALATLAARKSEPATAWLEVAGVRPRPAGLRLDRNGTPYFSAGVRLTARQLLDLGHILRRNGRRGLFPVIPAALLREAMTGSPANAMYGLGFWLNRNALRPAAVERDVEEAIGAGLTPKGWAASCLSRSAPHDLIAMVGSRGQRVYVVPSRNQVIVRLGSARGFRDPDFLAAFYRTDSARGTR